MITVIASVVLTRLFGVMFRLNGMALRHVGVVPGLHVIAGVMMLGGRPMVLSGFFVMIGGFAVMFRCHLGHR